MRSLLTDYQPIHEPAPVLEEERERRPRRVKLENRALKITHSFIPKPCGTRYNGWRPRIMGLVWGKTV